jgi:AcrR family transcriptional regulator
VFDLRYGGEMPSVTRSAPKTPSPSSVESRLISATQDLLAGGALFTELSVGAIVEAAGVARSSFYAHFPDKTQLLRRLAADLGDSSFGLLADWDPSAASALQDLSAMMRQVLAHYRDRAPLLRAVVEVAAYDADTRRFWDDQLEVFVRHAQLLLHREQQAGRTPQSVDVEVASRMFVHGGMQAITQQVLSGAPAHDSAVAEELSAQQWFGSFRRPSAT